MPNSYFQFKQFIVEQEKCAMKVCTDSCLFGSWTEVEDHVGSILDIGTGTGLLSLMLAQKTYSKIEAIEIDNNAYLQSTENFNNSSWKERLTAHHGDARSFPFQNKFDFIICNPPFYENEVSSEIREERIAKHSMFLTLSDLMAIISNFLKEGGKFSLLLPYFRKDEFEKLAASHQFYPQETMLIKQTHKHDFFRYAGVFSKKAPMGNKPLEMIIKTGSNHYSPEAIALLKPYYLYL